MTALLQEVAKERIAKTNNAYANTAPLSDDDNNIIQFWGGGAGTSETGTTINLFQQHPPFDIIVIYGNQTVSVSNLGSFGATYVGDNPLFTDTNERLVEPGEVSPPARLKLEACEIIGMSTQYTISGEIISETYDLVINDISIPSA